jgi:hypothetical protein
MARGSKTVAELVAPPAPPDCHSEGHDHPTLAEARALMRHLPEGRRERRTWHHVARASELDAAAAGGNAADVSIALRMVLSTTRHSLNARQALPQAAVLRQKPAE